MNAGAMLDYMAKNGYRHHVCITKGDWAESIIEAFDKYLGFKIDLI